MALKRPPVLAALAAFVIVSALPAQEGGLTLERAVELALAGHPEIREAQARIEAARGRTLQFASRPEPQLTAGLEGIPLPGLREEGDVLEVRLGIEQVFEYPGKRSLRTDIGRKGEDLAGAELDRVRLLLAARVKTTPSAWTIHPWDWRRWPRSDRAAASWVTTTPWSISAACFPATCSSPRITTAGRGTAGSRPCIWPMRRP